MDNKDKIRNFVDWTILPVYVFLFTLITWVGLTLLVIVAIPAFCEFIRSLIFCKKFAWSDVKVYNNSKVTKLFSWWFSKQHEIMSMLVGEDPIGQLRRFEKTKSRSLVKINSKNKVYCFRGEWFDDAFGYFIIAITHEGKFLAMSTANGIEASYKNIGYIGNLQHDIYRRYFPGGYSIDWMDTDGNDEAFLTAYNIYQRKVSQLKKDKKENAIMQRDSVVRYLKIKRRGDEDGNV